MQMQGSGSGAPGASRLAVLLASLVVAAWGGPALGATSGVSDVNLAAEATATITITDASITLSPNQANYEAGYVVAEGAAGIAVQVQTNSSTGMVLSVKCADATPEIALTDLMFRTQTSPGGGGTSQAVYTDITAVDQTLWTTDTVQETGLAVDTDIRVENLWAYSDAAGGGKTTYTDQLTFTVAVQ